MKWCTSKPKAYLSALRWALSSSSSPILASCPRHRSFIVRSASCSVFRLASEKSVVEAMSLLIHGVGGTEQTLPLFLPQSSCAAQKSHSSFALHHFQHQPPIFLSKFFMSVVPTANLVERAFTHFTACTTFIHGRRVSTRIDLSTLMKLYIRTK